MFSYDEFIAKSKLYFGRADAASDDDERAIWQSLGLEFLLRAPLARQSAALLALPEGDSILYAAGVTVPLKSVKSIPTKTVLERLQKLDAQFGADRARQAALVVALRNEELHSSSPGFGAASREEWLPAWMDVVEAVCVFLGLAPEDLVQPELLDEARTYRKTSQGAISGGVKQKLLKGAEFFKGLTADEVLLRKNSIPAGKPLNECPACHQESLVLTLGRGRTQRSEYDEDSGEIRYTILRVVLEAACPVCGLLLHDTAEVVAAGLERLLRFDLSEDRYDGWRDAVGESELQAELDQMLREMAWGEEYGNE